jgi:hypothetical protein
MNLRTISPLSKVELVAEDEIEVLMVILMKFQMLKKDME